MFLSGLIFKAYYYRAMQVYCTWIIQISRLGKAFCVSTFCNSAKLREQIAMVTEMFALTVLQ